MKEGAFLFCPKCGNPVSKDDNFCAYCGKNLKEVRVNVTSDNNKDTNKIKKISDLQNPNFRWKNQVKAP